MQNSFEFISSNITMVQMQTSVQLDDGGDDDDGIIMIAIHTHWVMMTMVKSQKPQSIF